MSERWLPIPGYEGTYSVSEAGRVRSEDRIVTFTDGRQRHYPQCELKLCASKDNPYLQVRLGKGNSRYVHHLVAQAFIGPRPPGLDVLHANDIHTDNRAVNLSYGTRSQNIYDAVANGRHGMANRTECPHGHRYTPENTKVYKGRRFCRTCKRNWRSKTPTSSEGAAA